MSRPGFCPKCDRAGVCTWDCQEVYPVKSLVCIHCGAEAFCEKCDEPERNDGDHNEDIGDFDLPIEEPKQVQAPEEVWLLSKGGVYCPHWFRSEDHALDSEYYYDGAMAVRYVKAGGQ